MSTKFVVFPYHPLNGCCSISFLILMKHVFSLSLSLFWEVYFIDFFCKQLSESLIFLCCFHCYWLQLFFISFLLLALDLFCSSFSSFLREEIRLWLEVFLSFSCKYNKFPCQHYFCYAVLLFSLSSMYFLNFSWDFLFDPQII